MQRSKLAAIALSLALCATSRGLAEGPAAPAHPAGAMAGIPYGGTNIEFRRYLNVVTQLNMTPDFTLTKEEKTQLQQISQAFDNAQADYRKAHADEIKDLQSAMSDATSANQMDKMKEVASKMQDLMSKGPSAADYGAKAKAILTPDQQTAVAAAVKAQNEKGGGANR